MKPKFSPQQYIKNVARKLPVIKALINKTVFKNGIGYAVIQREKPNGDVLMAAFIVDIYACGVKDCFYRFCNLEEFNMFIDLGEGLEGSFEEYTSNYVSNLIYGAVDYATKLGLQAHPNFKLASYILDDREYLTPENIEFGHEGKPLYIEGPHDNATKINTEIEKRVGKEGYEFISKYEMGVIYDDDDDDDDDDELLDEAEWRKEVGNNLSHLTEIEKDSFDNYSSTAYHVNEMFDGDIPKLKEDYIKNPDLLCEKLNKIAFNEKLNDLKIDNEFLMEIKKLNVIRKAIMESVIVNEGITFILDPDFIDCFHNDINTINYFKATEVANMMNFGNQKLTVLFGMLNDLIVIWNDIEDFYIEEDFFDFYRSWDSKYEHIEFKDEMTYLIHTISAYELCFGRISREMIGVVVRVD